MADVIEGLEAITVHIRDIELSRIFYREVLGLREVSFLPQASRAAFALPGTSTRLPKHVQRPDESGREPGTVSGVVFAHHDPVAACAELERRGETIVDPPSTFPAAIGTVTLGVFADPEGNQFVLRHVRP
jgi:catechol 2,3-dioxygenase-like lactoylglutathione lyase family enzyme